MLLPFAHLWLPDLTDRAEYQLTEERIFVTEPPEWVPNSFVSSIMLKVADGESLSLLDSRALSDIGRAFQNHPWIDSVTKIEKRMPASVHIELTYRKPVAMVEVRDGLLPVDRAGRLLPPEDFTLEIARTYPRIVDVRSAPQANVGGEWGDDAVAAAARLAALLTETRSDGSTHWSRLKLTNIVAPRRLNGDSLDQLLLQVTTADGSRIVWGRAPGVSHPGELAAHQKLDRLVGYLNRFGKYSDRYAWEIDIRHWQEISRQRIARIETEPHHDVAGRSPERF